MAPHLSTARSAARPLSPFGRPTTVMRSRQRGCWLTCFGGQGRGGQSLSGHPHVREILMSRRPSSTDCPATTDTSPALEGVHLGKRDMSAPTGRCYFPLFPTYLECVHLRERGGRVPEAIGPGGLAAAAGGTRNTSNAHSSVTAGIGRQVAKSLRRQKKQEEAQVTRATPMPV